MLFINRYSKKHSKKLTEYNKDRFLSTLTLKRVKCTNTLKYIEKAYKIVPQNPNALKKEADIFNLYYIYLGVCFVATNAIKSIKR